MGQSKQIVSIVFISCIIITTASLGTACSASNPNAHATMTAPQEDPVDEDHLTETQNATTPSPVIESSTYPTIETIETTPTIILEGSPSPDTQIVTDQEHTEVDFYALFKNQFHFSEESSSHTEPLESDEDIIFQFNNALNNGKYEFLNP